MSGLGLVPNEIVGWRIKPDWYNFTVVLVKRHGGGKKAGQEYEEALGYCKSLESAVNFILQFVTRFEAEHQQEAVQARTGTVADAQSMLNAMQRAQKEALRAVAELQARMDAAGLNTPKKVTHFLGGRPPEEDGEEAQDAA
jgi:hypothetical protein